MAIQTLHLEHTPPESAVHVGLFRDVRNAAHLKQQLLSGNVEYEYAFIDAAMVEAPAPGNRGGRC